ncbi:MAG: methyltransferase domain-containing protein [Phycisphaerales bacterium]|nr:methyltransferase domain-containing protein [Phycisphaerales bacterium]
MITFYRSLRRFLHRKGILNFNEPPQYPSETSKVRSFVLPYCIGKGCDIGFGGDKIIKENCDGIDYAKPYARTGNDRVNIPCDVINKPIPVTDNYYDYVYSSHLIEDFEDTAKGLKEFIRILKPNGNLILVFPDQKVYEAHAQAKNEPTNPHHKHADMGLSFMLACAKKCGFEFDILFQQNCVVDYNVILVLKIKKSD